MTASEDIERLRYPIGKFQLTDDYTDADRAADIARIASLPGRLTAAVSGFTPEQFDTPYRPEGWTVRQLIHHLADSHMHAWIRIKWALTEDTPSIKAYDEKKYAETPDNRLEASVSLSILEAHHRRWALLLKELGPDELSRSFIHPVSGANITILRMIRLYSWHGEHHLAHITGLKQRMNW